MVPLSQKAARFLLIAAGAICVIGMVGPFQGVEETFVPADKAAHFIAFYGLTALMMAAFRKNRRLEIALAAALLGGSIEIAQMVVGRGVSLGDLAADTAGAFAVWVPMWLQSLRGAPYEERRAREAAKTTELA